LNQFVLIVQVVQGSEGIFSIPYQSRSAQCIGCLSSRRSNRVDDNRWNI